MLIQSLAARNTATITSTRQRIGIVGGGLSGLSVAYNILQKVEELGLPPVEISILDRSERPGLTGGSAVAGGLLHPFSPGGKLVHLGLEGLERTNTLIQIANQHLDGQSCILRSCIYRAAISEKMVTQQQKCVEDFPKFATWLNSDKMKEECGSLCLGGIRLSNGCKVVHVPTYLSGLWNACQSKYGNIHWCNSLDFTSPSFNWRDRLSDFDTVILSAGSGIFQSIDNKNSAQVPMTLVRGQSLEINVKTLLRPKQQEAVLCGHYVSPLPDSSKILLGATKEWKHEPWSKEEVAQNMKEKLYSICPDIFDQGLHQSSQAVLTVGWRVQSNRNKLGRVPIIGKLEDSEIHSNIYLFTGLGARGLIHHGVYGDILSRMILHKNDEALTETYPFINWWKTIKEPLQNK